MRKATAFAPDCFFKSATFNSNSTFVRTWVCRNSFDYLVDNILRFFVFENSITIVKCHKVAAFCLNKSEPKIIVPRHAGFCEKPYPFWVFGRSLLLFGFLNHIWAPRSNLVINQTSSNFFNRGRSPFYCVSFWHFCGSHFSKFSVGVNHIVIARSLSRIALYKVRSDSRHQVIHRQEYIVTVWIVRVSER